MKKIMLLVCFLAMAVMGMSCSSDHHDTNTYSGYGAGNNNTFPTNNNPTTTTITNPPSTQAG